MKELFLPYNLSILDKEKGDGVPEFKTYYEALNKGIEIALNSIEI